MSKSTIVCTSFLMLSIPIFSISQFLEGKQNREATRTTAAGDWWKISDEDFVKEYGKLATGSQQEQSQFAWMVFARANQQVPFGGGTFSQWELWPSNPDTFAPNVPRFQMANKIRTRPHLEPIRQLEMHPGIPSPHPFPTAGEEVTRNPTSYEYIVGKNLNTAKGIATYFGNPNAKIDFPLGAVEIKALWVNGAKTGAFQEGGYSLTGIHLMVKVKPTPAQPFTDDNPSWFWTTFELKSNPDLAAAQKFITYPNLLPPADITKLLNEAGLGKTPFTNYVSNGQQTQYDDAKHKTIILGNTQIEGFLAVPANQPPSKWTAWNTSCHTCHGQASGIMTGGLAVPNNFTFPPGPTGPLAGPTLPKTGSRPYDFVWSLARAQ